MEKFSDAKKIVLDYFNEMESCTPEQCAEVMKKICFRRIPFSRCLSV